MTVSWCLNTWILLEWIGRYSPVFISVNHWYLNCCLPLEPQSLFPQSIVSRWHHLMFHDDKLMVQSVECVLVRWCVVCSDSCLSPIWGDYISSSGVCRFERKLISFQSHLLLYSLTVSLLFRSHFCESNRISVFLSIPAIYKQDCFVHHYQNTEESTAIYLCSKVWNHLVSLSLC